MTPDSYTIQELMLNVGDGHELYVQDWGNKAAKTPIVFLHGGPGAGVSDKHKSRFDPLTQRVIFFDQRGAGNSTPQGSIENNTTQDLVEDIQRLTNHLNLDSFILTGGSWGVCLAFAYAIQYPARVKAMVLSGIYTATLTETAHIDNGGFRSFYPDVWERYVNHAPKEYADDPSKFHYAQALGSDSEVAKASIYAYSEMEGSLLSLDDRFTTEKYDDFDPNNMKIELHYLANNCFIPEGYIAQNANQLTMPIWLVQGRYDMVCPPVTAYKLHKQLKNSHLIWTVAGHGNDRANYDVMKTILLQASGE